MGKVVFHVVLPTETKMFCGCPIPVMNEEGDYKAASDGCPVCQGIKGAYPILNKKVIEEAVAVVLSLNGKVTQYTLFDRVKDVSGVYNLISQYSYPIGTEGFIELSCDDMENEAVRIDIPAMRLKESEEEKGIPILEIVSGTIEEEHNSYYIEEVEKILTALGMEVWEIIETDDLIETIESKNPLSYLPDPDLPPVIISQWWINQIAARYPDLIHIEEPEIEEDDDF